MILQLLDYLAQPKNEIIEDKISIPDVAVIKKVPDRTISYTQRYRSQWFKPDFNFEKILVAAAQDSYMFRAKKKKIDRLMLSDFEFVSENEEALEYIKMRVKFMEIASNKPWKLLMEQTLDSVLGLGNAMWIKTRDNDRSPGDIRVTASGKELHPVAAYFILPFERLEFKTKQNGDLMAVREMMPDGKFKEFSADEIIHFYVNRPAGQLLGFSEFIPALDDVKLLRSLEENVQELIETSLYPRYHYKIGTDEMPAVQTREGMNEVQYVQKMVEYMPPGAVYVSDHRQDIQVIGAESKALRIDFYLSYFKARALTSIGTSALDMGEGDSANKSTASTLSKGTMMDIEALQATLKKFIEFYIINELLIEGGFNPLDESEQVFIRFGIIDKEERMAQENQIIQLFINNLITRTHARKELGFPPLKEEELEDTFFKLISEPLALIQASGSPGSATTQAAGENPNLSITTQMAKHEQQHAMQMEQRKAAMKAKTMKSGNKSASRSRPSNQHGTRKGPKTTKDLTLDINGLDFIVEVPLDCNPSDNELANFKDQVLGRASLLVDSGISLQTIINNQSYKLYEEINDTN